MLADNVLHHGLTFEQYAAEPGLRSGDLKALMRSPAHYAAMKKKQKPESDALRFGKIFHMAMETPAMFRQLLAVEPEFVGVTKDGKPTTSKNASDVKDQRKRWLGDLPPGAIVVSEEEAFNLHGMLESVLRHKLVGNLVKDGVRESSLWTTDPETGLRIKARYDFISAKGFPVDFKTTTDARPSHFLNEIFSTRGESPRFYALSGSHYSHVGKVAKVCEGESMTFIAVEKEEPWGVWVYPMDRHALEVGDDWRKKLYRVHAECMKTDTWPSYPEVAEPVQIPQYVKWMGDEDLGL